MSTKEILDIIYSMPSQHCELDPIPTNVFKKIAPEIIQEITVTINTCMTSGKFPEDLKLALVKPLLMKLNLELICYNYRPVSNLTFLS